jgi:hypothetical protein
MDAQEFRSLQEAYLEVVGNQQLDEASGGIIGGKTFPSKNVPEKSKSNKPSKIGRSIIKSIHSASFGLSQEKPKDIVSRHKEYTDKELDTVSRRGDEPKPEKGRSRSPREFQLKVIEREKRRRQKANEEVDLYDIILSHLLDEGYADTPEAAEAIMVSMSEEWREEIVEAYVPYEGKPQEKLRDKQEKLADRWGSPGVEKRFHKMGAVDSKMTNPEQKKYRETVNTQRDLAVKRRGSNP